MFLCFSNIVIVLTVYYALQIKGSSFVEFEGSTAYQCAISPLSRMAFYGNTKSANQSEKSFCASARSVPMIVVAFSLILESSEPNGSPGKLVVQTKEMVCGQCKRRRKVNRITQRVCIVVDIVEMIISHTKFCSRVLAKAAAASGIAVGIDFHPNVHHPTALI